MLARQSGKATRKSRTACRMSWDTQGVTVRATSEHVGLKELLGGPQVSLVEQRIEQLPGCGLFSSVGMCTPSASARTVTPRARGHVE